MRLYLLEIKYEFLKAARNPQYALPTLIFPMAFYYFFGVLFGSRQSGGVRMAEYLLATYSTFGVIGAALFGFGVTIAIERGHGWLEAKRTTPMPIAAYFVAKLVMAMLFSAIVVVLLFTMGWTLAHVTLPFTTALTLLATLVCGSITFCALGLAVGFYASPSSAAAIVNLLYLPMGFISGLWIPIQFLPKQVHAIAEWLPPYHFAQLALRVIGAAREGSIAVHIAAMLAATAVFASIAYAGARRDARQVH
ncbi:MAG: ABC transporter permease [Acidobacteriota bacterium]|nr:ABC transporter permease [Acidobacteriota bacterium]